MEKENYLLFIGNRTLGYTTRLDEQSFPNFYKELCDSDLIAQVTVVPISSFFERPKEKTFDESEFMEIEEKVHENSVSMNNNNQFVDVSESFLKVGVDNTETFVQYSIDKQTSEANKESKLDEELSQDLDTLEPFNFDNQYSNQLDISGINGIDQSSFYLDMDSFTNDQNLLFSTEMKATIDATTEPPTAKQSRVVVTVNKTITPPEMVVKNYCSKSRGKNSHQSNFTKRDSNVKGGSKPILKGYFYSQSVDARFSDILVKYNHDAQEIRAIFDLENTGTIKFDADFFITSLIATAKIRKNSIPYLQPMEVERRFGVTLNLKEGTSNTNKSSFIILLGFKELSSVRYFGPILKITLKNSSTGSKLKHKFISERKATQFITKYAMMKKKHTK